MSLAKRLVLLGWNFACMEIRIATKKDLVQPRQSSSFFLEMAAKRRRLAQSGFGWLNVMSAKSKDICSESSSGINRPRDTKEAWLTSFHIIKYVSLLSSPYDPGKGSFQKLRLR